MTYHGGRLPSSVGEFALLFIVLVGTVATIAIGVMVVLSLLSFVLQTSVMAIVSHGIAMWMGAILGILLLISTGECDPE